MDAIRVFARRVGLSLEQSRFVLHAARSMYDVGFSARLHARRSRSGVPVAAGGFSARARRSLSGVPVAAGPSITGGSTHAAEVSSSSPRTQIGLLCVSAASTTATSSTADPIGLQASTTASSSSTATPLPSSWSTAALSSSTATAFGSACSTAAPSSSTPTPFGSAASEACATSPFSSSSMGFLGSAASNGCATTSWATPLSFSAASIPCTATPSSWIASGDSPCFMRHLTPGYRRAIGDPFSVRRFGTSSASTASNINQQHTSSRVKTESATITYVEGMFDDVNEGRWTPFEYVADNVPLMKVKLVGDRLEKEYTVLTEVGGKRLFASLLLLIEKLDEHGYSFCHLELSQLRVDKYGQFVLSDGTLLEKSCKRSISEAYFRAAGVFEFIIRHSCGPSVDLPRGFRDLLHALRMRRTPHGWFFLSHPSLMPLHFHSQAFLDVYDYVKNILPDKKADKVIASLSRSVKFWVGILDENELLQEWFYHESCSRYDVKDRKHLFKYLRNVHSHMLEYLGAIRYSKDDLRLLVECKFGRVMSSLYMTMWNVKVLPGIETEKYFCLPGGACCPKPGFCLRKKLRMMVMPKEVAEMMMLPNKSS